MKMGKSSYKDLENKLEKLKSELIIANQKIALLCKENEKQALDVSRNSEEEYRNLIEFSPVAMAIIHDWKTIYVNPAAVQLFGAKMQDELIGKQITELIHPDFHDLASENAKLLTEIGYVKIQEQRYLKLDGTVLDVETQAKSIRFNGEKSTLVVINDITERKKAEEKIKESEEKYRLLFENANEAIYVVQNEKLVFVNPACEQITGILKDNLKGLSIIDLVDENDKENISKHHYELINGIIQNGNGFFTINNQKGEKRHLSVNSVRINWNGLPATLNFGTDITERNKFEQALRKSEEKNMAIVLNTPDHIIIHDRDIRYTLVVNPQMGLTEKDMLGKTDYDFLSKDDADKLTNVKMHVMESKEPFHIETSLISALGKEEFFDGSFIPTFDENSEVNGLIGYFKNVTERKLYEDKLIRNQHNLAEAERIGHTGSWEYDVATDTAVWSENMFRIFDVDPQMPNELVFTHFVENLVHPADRQELLSVFTDALNGKRAYDLNYRTIKKNGSVRIIHAIAETIFDETAKAIRMIGKVEDVTESTLAVQALKESEEKYRSTIESISDAFFTLDKELRFTYFNKKAEVLLLKKSDEVIGKQIFSEVFKEAKGSIFEEKYTKALSEHNTISFETFFGIEPYINWYDVRVHPGDCGISVYFTIITERKLAEGKIKESEEKFKSLMQQSPFVVELYDLKGMQISVNKAYEELWGFPAERTLNIFNVLESKEVEETGLIAYVKRAYEGNSVVVPEYIYDPTGDTEAKGVGRKRWLNTRIYPLKDESGNVNNIVIVHQDITERKLAEFDIEMMNELNADMNRGMSLENLIDKAKMLINNTFSANHTTVYVTSADNTYLTIKNNEVKKEYLTAFEKILPFKIPKEIKLSLSGDNWYSKVISERKIRITENTADIESMITAFVESNFPSIPFKKYLSKSIAFFKDITCIVCVPLIVDKKIIGLLDINLKTPPTERDVERIEKFAEQLVVIINRKKAEEELFAAKEKAEESEEKYRILFEANKDGITIFYAYPGGKVSNFIEMNESAGAMLGYTKAELSEMKPSDIEIDPTEEKIVKRLSDLQTKGFSNFETSLKHKNGSTVIVEITVLLINYNKLPALMNITRDITERKLAEDELMKSEKEFRQLAESMPQIVWITRPDGWNIFFNQQWVDYTGLSLEESCGAGWNKPFHPDDQQSAWDAWQNATTHLTTYSIECRLRRFDGEYKWWLIRGIPVLNADGKVIKWFGTCTDIDEIKLAEAELVKIKEKAEESDRLKSAFLANMSHEIRTPMNGIMGFAELLKVPNLAGEQQQNYIQIIEKSGARMLNIINDIVCISKIESGTMEIYNSKTNINEQVKFVYNLLMLDAAKKNLKLSYKNDLPDKASSIITDNDKFISILSNLVKNAIKYTDQGSIEFGYNIVKNKNNDYVLQFYVKDTGIGIPKDRQEPIFERFIQADIADKMARQGVGLGLSISRAYVAMLGGDIWVESEEGKGSTFYFTIPYNVEPSKNSIAESGILTEAEKQSLKLKVLIAEDDEISAMLISLNIEEFGKEVIIANTGTEAIEMCRKNPDIDLILMDIQLPDLNGYQATRKIRQFNKDVIIIAQTAFGLSGDREKAIEVGCNDYVAKPINKDELHALVHKYF